MDFLVVMAALVNAGGWAWEWYRAIAWFDEFVRAFTSFAVVAAILGRLVAAMDRGRERQPNVYPESRSYRLRAWDRPGDLREPVFEPDVLGHDHGFGHGCDRRGNRRLVSRTDHAGCAVLFLNAGRGMAAART